MHTHMCKSVCACKKRYTHVCECGYIDRGQRVTFVVGPHLPPCLRQGLCCFSTAFTRLAGLKSSGDSPVFIANLLIGMLGL